MDSGRRKTAEHSGDRFKSEGERQIARLLDRCGIGYRYEHPLAVVDRGKTRVWYPDFFLPDHGVILEYTGLNGKNSYQERLRHKESVYEALGVPVLYIKPETFRGFWPAAIIEGIQKILEERLETFRHRAEQGLERSLSAAPPGKH